MTITAQDKNEIIGEVYDSVSSQIMEFAYYAENLEKNGRKKEAEGLREIASRIEDWLADARL